MLFRLGERVADKPLARELGALLATRRRGLRRRPGLRADIHARYTHLTIEARERVTRVGEAQLFPNPLEQPARHTAPEYVAEHQQRVLAAVGVRNGVGGEYDVGLGGILGVTGFGAADGGRNGNRRRRFPFPPSRFPIVKPPMLA